MRILVCGGRNFGWRWKEKNGTITRGIFTPEYDLFYDTLSAYLYKKQITKLISGGAIGADRLAEEFAQQHQLPIEIYYAQWNKYRKSAGPIRNAQMLREGQPDLVLAFPRWQRHRKYG